MTSDNDSPANDRPEDEARAETVGKDALFEPALPERDVAIPGRGTVRVRALTRAEALEIRGVEIPVAHMERKLVSAAMVAPKLSEKDVDRWQRAAAAGELEPVTDAITELSGMKKTAGKEAVKTFRG